MRVVNGETVETEDVAVRLVRSRKVLVTTDKPLYQPGQIVNVRALALRTTDKTPEANQAVIFEIEDGKGPEINFFAGDYEAYHEWRDKSWKERKLAPKSKAGKYRQLLRD